MKTMRKFELYGNSFSLGWDVLDLRGSKAVRVYHTPSLDDARSICELLNETENIELVPNSKFKFEYVLLKVSDHYYLFNTELGAKRRC